MTDERKRRTRVDGALDDMLGAGDRDAAGATPPNRRTSRDRARRGSAPQPTPPASSTSAETDAAGGRMVPVRLRASGRFAVLASGKRIRRTVYVPPDVWLAVSALAVEHGVSAADVVSAALAVYLAEHAGEGLDHDDA